MLSLEEALARLLAHASRAAVERVSLTDAAGRVLADPRIVAAVDVPPFANSSMDGFALRSADAPGVLRVTGEVAAGVASLPAVEPGTAVRIMTGAPMPPGADAVVPVEDAAESDGVVSVARPVTSGAFVRAAAHDTRAGDEVLLAGPLTPAKAGRAGVAGARRGRGAAAPGRGDPVDRRRARRSRRAARARADPRRQRRCPRRGGGRCRRRAAAPAARRATTLRRSSASLRDAAASADLIVTSGGVSVGRHDHVRAVLERHGTIDFWRIAVQPGKPLAVGELGGTTVIGLPGNPVSALVTFELFVRPFIRAMLGLRRRRPVAGAGRWPPSGCRRTAGVGPSCGSWSSATADGYVARAAGGQQSSQLRPMADANALLVVPEGADAAEPGVAYEAIVLEPLS